ncbi:hypothetical protein [Caulobacter hibisci]|uniref:DUF3298 domain-containing protein n=1 Tax=Caulobacter hibisci TaxID=2035993 RepID=A0ABS0STQ5_9CAUL|nr:hypothetical protein [Caulobacter hibisci]MBI1683037.1 hypothetical protein [Caulobacter hibisci]
MKFLVIAGVVLGAALAATPAAAREACAVRPATQAIALPSGNMQADLAALLSMGPALQDKPTQRKALLKAKAKCDAPGFEAGGRPYAVFETGEASPILVARSADADAPIFFVVPFANIMSVVMAEVEKRPVPAAEANYLLVISTKAGASALRVYRSAPDGAALQADVLAALQGKLPPLVSRDEKTKNVRINLMMDAYEGPKSKPGFTPPPGSAVAPPVTSPVPQNASFQEQPGGAALHPASGFACPVTLDGFKRDRLTVYDAAQGGRDVSCGYGASGATATLYLTKLPEQYTLTRVFDAYVQQAKAHTPAASDVTDPYPAADGGPRRLGKFWRDPQGRNEGLWLMQIGPWFAKLRVTYSDAAAPDIRHLATDLLGAVDEQVKPPVA